LSLTTNKDLKITERILKFEKGIQKVSGKPVGFIEIEKAKTSVQVSSQKIAEISNFSELKKTVGFLRKEDIAIECDQLLWSLVSKIGDEYRKIQRNV